MSDIFFTEEHEYVKVEGDDDIATVGVSDYAQEALGDIVYVELPEVGAVFAQGEQAGVVESVKSASEIYAPVSGEVIEVNEDLSDSPAKVNQDAMDDGWIYKIKMEDVSELKNLKNETEYKNYIESL